MVNVMTKRRNRLRPEELSFAEGLFDASSNLEAIRSDDPEARRKERETDDRENFANPFKAAELGYIDEVIRPEDTRRKIIQSLEMLANKRDSLPRNNPSNPKYKLMIEVWRRMPRSFANTIGPFIVRNLG